MLRVHLTIIHQDFFIVEIVSVVLLNIWELPCEYSGEELGTEVSASSCRSVSRVNLGRPPLCDASFCRRREMAERERRERERIRLLREREERERLQRERERLEIERQKLERERMERERLERERIRIEQVCLGLPICFASLGGSSDCRGVHATFQTRNCLQNV